MIYVNIKVEIFYMSYVFILINYADSNELAFIGIIHMLQTVCFSKINLS